MPYALCIKPNSKEVLIMKYWVFFLLIFVAAIVMIGCEQQQPVSSEAAQIEPLTTEEMSVFGEMGNSLNKHRDIPRVVKELREARKATKKYRDLNKALADGYADANVFVPKMGYHYLKAEILDATFNHKRPELLVYANVRGKQGLQLVALEYAVPTNLSATPPAGFTGDFDQWDRNDAFGLWTLHAWVWLPNPDGVFADFNPRLPE
jgi:hypothetical protein